MPNDKHAALLKQGVDAWNAWRRANPDFAPDLRGAQLHGADLREANLRNANLKGANLSEANLSETDLGGALLRDVDFGAADLSGVFLGGAFLRDVDLSGAHLSGANLKWSYLSGANLSGAYLFGADLKGALLQGANLSGAHLSEANLNGANLSGADLIASTILNADLTSADLTGCYIHGVSAWGLKLEGTKQQNLVITPHNEPEITVDNIEVAQFIYLMLHNQKIRDVIDTITSKAVLILGRFTKKRKPVLEALRRELRQRKYLPILFDFEKPRSRSRDETITLLARMARFVVADVTDAKSVLHELRAIVPDLPSVPVQPIILATQKKPGMFDFYQNNKGFLDLHPYVSQKQLIADLGEKVIGPAERKVLDLRAST